MSILHPKHDSYQNSSDYRVIHFTPTQSSLTVQHHGLKHHSFHFISYELVNSLHICSNCIWTTILHSGRFCSNSPKHYFNLDVNYGAHIIGECTDCILHHRTLMRNLTNWWWKAGINLPVPGSNEKCTLHLLLTAGAASELNCALVLIYKNNKMIKNK